VLEVAIGPSAAVAASFGHFIVGPLATPFGHRAVNLSFALDAGRLHRCVAHEARHAVEVGIVAGNGRHAELLDRGDIFDSSSVMSRLSRTAARQP